MVAFLASYRYGEVVAARLVTKRSWFHTRASLVFQVRRERFTAKTPMSEFVPDGVAGWVDVKPEDLPLIVDAQRFLDRQVIRET